MKEDTFAGIEQNTVNQEAQATLLKFTIQFIIHPIAA